MSALNPLHTNIPKIYMVAILRYSDKTVVATYSTSKEVTKEGIRELVAGNAQMTAGRRYTSQGDSQSIHYTLDAQGRVYAVVTNPQYPPRVVFGALDELQSSFAEFDSKVANATEESLSKPARLLLKDFTEKYVKAKIINIIFIE
jgi:hypothetical protein